MKGLFIPDITAEMFRNGCLEGIEALMAEGEIYDIDYTGWIPVSEKLPLITNGEVLATTRWGEITIADRFSMDKWFIHEGNSNAVTSDILAWMPLPKPYREDGEE